MTWRIGGSFLALFDVEGIGEVKRDDTGNNMEALRLDYSREGGMRMGGVDPIPSSTPAQRKSLRRVSGYGTDWLVVVLRGDTPGPSRQHIIWIGVLRVPMA